MIRRRRIPLLRSVAVAALAALACVAVACAAPAPPRHYEFVIPEGTAGLIATNRAPEIFPPNLVVHVGDSLTIINDDKFVQEVGPYRLKPKSRISQHFSSPEVLEGTCAMSMGGSLTVTVLPKKT
ncbi:MAG: hypothetical protein U0Q22_06110 [Acidimicrobiales bacterium]